MTREEFKDLKVGDSLAAIGTTKYFTDGKVYAVIRKNDNYNEFTIIDDQKNRHLWGSFASFKKFKIIIKDWDE